jgi:hypothetical protein
MKKKNSAAVKLGKIKTAKKATAARENGRKGGRKESQALRDARMEAFQALRVIYEIRVAVGDPEGKLMLDKLIEHCRKMRGLLERADKALEDYGLGSEGSPLRSGIRDVLELRDAD